MGSKKKGLSRGKEREDSGEPIVSGKGVARAVSMTRKGVERRDPKEGTL